MARDPRRGLECDTALHLTSREVNRLKPTQAQTIVAAAILRQLYAVITTGQAWDPDIATHGVRQANPAGGVAA